MAGQPDPLSETRSAILQVGQGLEVRYQEHRLLVESGPDAGREHLLGDRPVVLGRGRSADLRLADDTVSREHARIRPRGEGWVVHDLDSKGGTWVDGVRVDSAALAGGRRVRLGETELVLCSDETSVPLAPQEESEFEGMIGSSEAMRRVFGWVRKVGPSDLTVLLRGESGTGKEGLARALHRHSSTPEGPFVVVDGALLTAEHLRSELFGHRRGAFTGAQKDRQGAFEHAHGGTLFLDEVGELPLEIQPQLLRVLEEGEVRPLGSDEVVRVRVRVVSATNQDLSAEVRQGRFRSDLFYRLSAFTIEIPPLRERCEDVLPLARRFLPPAYTLSVAARRMLEAAPWPGNVRQLRDAIRRAVVLAEGLTVEAEDLMLDPTAAVSAAPSPGPAPVAPPPAAAAPSETASSPPEAEADTLGVVATLEDQEARIILETLERCGRNRRETARLLGISRATLYRKLKKIQGS